MEKFGKGQPVTRVEDIRFLTGQGAYVDDTAPPGAFHAVFLRSTLAHGRIRTLDTSAARAADGVRLVVTAADLRAAGVRLDMKTSRIRNLDGTLGHHPERPLLARSHVRFVGEAIAMIVADTLLQAKDALELIELDIEDLPPHIDLAPGGPQIHDSVPDNIAFDWGKGDRAAVEAACATAAHVVRLRIPDNRVIANPMETRGVWAEMQEGRLHVANNGQGV